MSGGGGRPRLPHVPLCAAYNIVMIPVAAGVLMPWVLDMPPVIVPL